MGTPEIDPQTRGLVPLRFCEYNHIVPLRLVGEKLTVVAAHPESYELRTALAGLRAKYNVEILKASEDEVTAIIDANYYGRCEGCGEKIDYGCKWCVTCRHRMNAAPAPPAPGVVSVPSASVSADVAAGPDLAGKNCPFCQTPIKPGSPVHLCGSCGIPHHAECWRENGGCTTFGCDAAVLPGNPQTQSQAAYAVAPQPSVHHPNTYHRRPMTVKVPVILLIAVVLIPTIWWVSTAKTREFRADARLELREFDRIESRLDAGVPFFIFAGMVGDLRDSMSEFRGKYEADFDTDDVFKDLDQAEQAYVDSLDSWNQKIDAPDDDFHDYESDMQDSWQKASDAIQNAHELLGT